MVENHHKSIEIKILKLQKLVDEDLSDYTHNMVLKYPRVERFMLCKRIEDSVAKILLLTIEVKKKYYKKTSFRDMDIEMDYLRRLIRFSYRHEYISLHQFEIWSKTLNEAAIIVHDLVKVATKLEGSN